MQFEPEPNRAGCLIFRVESSADQVFRAEWVDDSGHGMPKPTDVPTGDHALGVT